MGIPKELLEKSSDAFGQFLDVSISASKHAARITGERFNPRVWRQHLPPLDFHLAFLSHFYGTWENSGDFGHQLECWIDEADMVADAFRAFGCDVTADRFLKGIPIIKRIYELPDTAHAEISELGKKIEQLGREAGEDARYEKLMGFIREHQDEFFKDETI